MSSSSNIPLFLCSLLFVFLLLLEPSLSATERCHPNEKKVLLKIKKSFNATKLNRSWLPNTDCCGWYGVLCHSPDNHIYTLTFLDGEFPGPIPDAIADLPTLAAITFKNVTALSGPIPFFITKLQNLQALQIMSSNLTGTVPGFLSKLKKLTLLDLSNNQLTGSVPGSLSEIPNLAFIDLSRNRLTGTIPESFVKLKHINGPHLFLAHNGLSGEIPPSFGDINFGRIDLSYNNLRGDISMLFGRNKSAGYMNFARNSFEFDMSKFQKNRWLIELDISHNKIYGSLPKEMISKEYWLSLNVSYNRLCGPIPQGGNLQTNFNYTSFFHNRCLCGAPLTVACK